MLQVEGSWQESTSLHYWGPSKFAIANLTKGWLSGAGRFWIWKTFLIESWSHCFSFLPNFPEENIIPYYKRIVLTMRFWWIDTGKFHKPQFSLQICYVEGLFLNGISYFTRRRLDPFCLPWSFTCWVYKPLEVLCCNIWLQLL